MQRKRNDFEAAVLDFFKFSVEDIIQTSVATDDTDESEAPTGTVLPWDTSK